jgi:MOSC domain-containing protein YiiM
MLSMFSLRERLRDVPQEGRVSWIGLRPARGAEMQIVDTAAAIAGRGLTGDRARSGDRGITLLQAEHLPVIARFAKRPALAPQQLRRNLVIEGINLLALVKLTFAIGDEVVLVGTGPCAPCGKLDELIGPGGFQATRGHGGITARIERGGTLRVGDHVRVVDPATRRR